MMRLSRQDLRLAVRSFARHPGFTITAVLSLALAISLNTTMYSVLDAMVNPKLDVRNPDRFYTIALWGDTKRKVGDAEREAMIRSGFRTYDAVTFQGDGGGRVAVEYGRGFAETGRMVVAPNLFDVLGVRPQRGRLFVDADMSASLPPLVITERLAAALSPDEPFPVGAQIFLDGVRRPVIGIVSRASVLPTPGRADVFMLPTVPMSKVGINVVRLRKGVKIEDAVAEFALMSTRIAIAAGESPKYTRYELKSATKPQFSPQRFHFALVAAVFAVLLVACANLANLQLARGIGRARELALRTALGASRRDLIAQLMLESALLAAVGLVAGLLFTFLGVHILESRIPPSAAEYVIAPQISWRVCAFAVIAGVACTILVGLYPAIRVSRVDPNELLKSGAGTGANKSNRRQYGIMVAAEIGLALALLSGASLVVRTAVQVRSLHLGYDAKRLATGYVALQFKSDTMLRVVAYANELLSRIRSAPDVADAAIDLQRGMVRNTITVDERGGTPHEYYGMFGYHVVSSGYFRTMGLPILKGRDFLDGTPTSPEVILDQHTARSLLPGVDPIGMQIKLGEYKSNAPWVRVVGVVPETNSPRQLVMYNAAGKWSRVGDVYYLPAAADSVIAGERKMALFSFVARAKSDPVRLPITLQRFLPRGDLVRWATATAMEESLGIVSERARHDFVASVFSVFAALGVGLAALGIYGIVTHSVAERKRELGVRLALGATARDILHAVLREGNVVALAGVAVGLYFTKRTAGWLHAFIFEDDQYNAPVFATVAAVLFTVAVLSALWPALRATRIDPVEALRSE